MRNLLCKISVNLYIIWKSLLAAHHLHIGSKVKYQNDVYTISTMHVPGKVKFYNKNRDGKGMWVSIKEIKQIMNLKEWYGGFKFELDFWNGYWKDIWIMKMKNKEFWGVGVYPAPLTKNKLKEKT